MENLEELVDLSIQEICQPIDQLGPESPIAKVSPHCPPQYPPQVMVVVVNQPRLRTRMPLSMATPLHGLHKKSE